MKGNEAETQCRDLVTGTEAGVTQECYIHWLPLACSFISYKPCTGMDPHSGLPLSSISNQENVPTDMPTGQSDRANSSNEILSSKLYLGLC